jgi:hypothetical protein
MCNHFAYTSACKGSSSPYKYAALTRSHMQNIVKTTNHTISIPLDLTSNY